MKIVCDSCGAKYSIADEKVAGKVFKIRCKKCGAIIVVRGDQVAADAAQQQEAAAVDEQGSDAIWHVVVDGEQQGPFVPDQISELMSAGTVDWESYVWREGFEGWLAARDVPELVEAISGQSQEEAARHSQEEQAQEQGAESSMGEDPFAAGQEQAQAFAGAEGGAIGAEADAGAAASLFSGADAGFGGGGADLGGADLGGADLGGADLGGADLFGQGADMGASPFEAGVPADDDLIASSPGPRVSAEQAAMTGQRNENSVLFSLSNLQALATGSGSSAPPPAGSLPPMAGQASGEGSGLIDIRALASTGVGGNGSLAPGRADSGVDDLLSIGTGSPLGGSALGAPVLAPVQEDKPNRMLIYGFAVAAGVLGLALVVVVVLLLNRETEPLVATADVTGQIDAPQQAPGTTALPAAPTETPTEPGSEAAAGQPSSAAGADTEDRPSSSSGRSTTRRRTGSRPSSRSDTDSTPAPASTPMTTSMGGSELDNLLDQALGGGPAKTTRMASPMRAAPAASDLPETPPREAVRRGLQTVQGAVSSCGQGQHGTATTSITIRGSTGRVSSASVSGQFQGTPVGSCVARAARAARFPRFTRDTFNVTFPFRI